MYTPAETRDIANLAIRLCDGKDGDYNNAAVLSAVACAIYPEWKTKRYEDLPATSKFLAEFGEYMLKQYRSIEAHRKDITQEFNAYLPAWKVAQRMQQSSTPVPKDH